MDNLTLSSFFFACPIRLVWANFQRMMGEQDDPGDSIDFLVPQIAIGLKAPPSLENHFGIPKSNTGYNTSALWHRAANRIWNEFFRDENLQAALDMETDDGPDVNGANYSIQRRGKRADYFTSCLPWPAKEESVPLSPDGQIPIKGIGKTTQTFPNTSATVYETDATGTVVYADSVQVSNFSGDTRVEIEEDPTNAGFPGVYADLSTAALATVNTLRVAFAIQKLLEKDARGGTRYTETVRSHFGVISPDARLNRPEFLGGGTQPITVTPVPQTSEDGSTPQANLAAYGTSSSSSHSFVKSFVEHCVIIGFVSVQADLSYQQGLNRMFSRRTRYDFYWPSFAHLGEMAVLNKEIWLDPDGFPDVPSDSSNAVFGYQEQWGDMKYKPSMITGLFRSDAGVGGADSIDVWHLAQEFAALPTLSSDFIEDDPPIDRVISVTDQNHFLFDAYFQLTCVRPIPTNSIPGMMDRF